MIYRHFVRLLIKHGFILDRQRGSHRIYKGIIDGQVRLVVVAYHRESEEIKPGTLASMIRDSRLDKKLFK